MKYFFLIVINILFLCRSNCQIRESSKFLHLKKIISCELNSQQLNELRYDQTDSLISNLATNRMYFRPVLIRCGIQNNITDLIIFGKTFNPKQEYLMNYLVICTSRFLKDGSLVSTKIYYDLKLMDELVFEIERRT